MRPNSMQELPWTDLLHCKGVSKLKGLQKFLLWLAKGQQQCPGKGDKLLPHCACRHAHRVTGLPQAQADHKQSRLAPHMQSQATSQEAHHGSLLRAALAGGHPHAQHGCARVAHDGLHIRKVHIHQARDGDDVGDALDSLFVSPTPDRVSELVITNALDCAGRIRY